MTALPTDNAAVVGRAKSLPRHRGSLYARLIEDENGARIDPRSSRLLVAVWHVLTTGFADRHAIPVDVAKSFFRLAYRMGVRHLKGESALTFTRRQLDRLKLGQELTILPWGNKRFKLPPSSRASPIR